MEASEKMADATLSFGWGRLHLGNHRGMVAIKSLPKLKEFAGSINKRLQHLLKRFLPAVSVSLKI
jgi:hypothetical protein